MSAVVFSVSSESSGEIYRLEASQTRNGIRFTCTCQAGQNGLHCKHRMAILLNDTRSCVDIDKDAIANLRSMAAGSELLMLVEHVSAAEAEVAEAQKALKRAKKDLAKAMQG